MNLTKKALALLCIIALILTSLALPTAASDDIPEGIAVKGTPVIDGQIDAAWADGSDPERMHNYYTQLYNEAVFELGLTLIEDYRTGRCRDAPKTLDAIIEIFKVSQSAGLFLRQWRITRQEGGLLFRTTID